MNASKKHVIEWGSYGPSPAMKKVISRMNQQSLHELLAEMPPAKMRVSRRVAFDYRIYTQYSLQEVEVVYILLNGFGVRAATPDSGVKERITDLLLGQVEQRKYAVLVVGGLFSFRAAVRTQLRRQGSGALAVVAEEVADLLPTAFPSLAAATVSGYSLGGVLAPLVARALCDRGTVKVEQVCCGEPNYTDSPLSSVQLLQRVAHATAYRNEQITATAIRPYIAVKQTPDTSWAVLVYRAKQYRPLLYRSLSMRLVAQDLALQAGSYPDASRAIQVQEALFDLANRGVRINLLHAEGSSVCHRKPFTQLAARLAAIADDKLTVVTVQGKQADHGIEEHRTLSTPFLVRPALYWAAELS